MGYSPWGREELDMTEHLTHERGAQPTKSWVRGPLPGTRDLGDNLIYSGSEELDISHRIERTGQCDCV